MHAGENVYGISQRRRRKNHFYYSIVIEIQSLVYDLNFNVFMSSHFVCLLINEHKLSL